MLVAHEKKKPRTLLQNTLALLAGNGIGAILSFVMTWLLAHALQPQGFGDYNVILAWVFPAMLIAEFGFSALIVRELSPQPENTRPFLRQLLGVRLAICLLATLVVYGLFWSGVVRISGAIFVALWLVPIYALFAMLSAALRARQQMHWIALLNVGMLLIQAALLLLAGSTLTVGTAILINSLTSLGQLAVATVVVWVITRHDQPTGVTLAWLPWLRACVPFAIANALGAVQGRLLILLIASQPDQTQVAYFVVATRFIDAARILPMAFFDAIFPRLSAQRHDPLAMRRTGVALLTVPTLYAVATAVIFTQGGYRLVITAFGLEYARAAQILTVLACLFIPQMCHAALNVYCYATGREIIANSVTLFVIVVTTAFAILLGTDLDTLSLLAALMGIELAACGVLLAVVFGRWRRQPITTTRQYIPAE